MNALELAKELIRIPSLTGDEEKILLRLEMICKDLGLATQRQPVADRRWNLFAGWSSDTAVVFCSHVDTVPPFLPLREDDTYIYGRGSCDTKGIIAAMISAGEILLRSGESPAFLFVVGEETDSIGAKIAAGSGFAAKYIIVGEPTDNMLASGHKGILSYTLHTKGQAAHSAYPELGNSAVHVLLDVLQRIRTHAWGLHPVLGPATFNIGLLQGGTAMNIMAPHASARVIHRLVDDANLRKDELLDLVGSDAEVEFHSIAQPQILHVVEGFEVKSVNYGTDIPYLSPMGQCLLFGPGSIHDAHTDAEKIAKADIEAAVLYYQRLYHQLTHES